MVKRTRFESLAKYYDFFTKLLMVGTYGGVRKRIVENGDGKYALDLCCGTGYVTGHIRSKAVVGLDLTPGMLRVNRAKNHDNKRITLITGDAYTLPFKEESFDSIYFTLASHEFRNIKPILEGANGVLRKGGEIIIYDIYKPESLLIRGYMVFIKHVVEFGKCWIRTLSEWRELLEEAGFRDVRDEVLFKASVIIRGRKK
jgi:demethylmenaquinone methyltransferase/2-methoxy-6-polyprenyl-1,4-benzoquinol methylase